jgi:hypothetical protein
MKQRKKLRVTKLDFIGLNHYTTLYVKDCIFSSCELDPLNGDARVGTLVERDGVPIGKEVTIRLLNISSRYIRIFFKKMIEKTTVNSDCSFPHADRSAILL